MKTFKGALIGLFFLTVFHFEMRDKLRINALLLHNHTQPTANRWLEIDTFFIEISSRIFYFAFDWFYRPKRLQSATNWHLY